MKRGLHPDWLDELRHHFSETFKSSPILIVLLDEAISECWKDDNVEHDLPVRFRDLVVEFVPLIIYPEGARFAIAKLERLIANVAHDDEET